MIPLSTLRKPLFASALTLMAALAGTAAHATGADARGSFTVGAPVLTLPAPVIRLPLPAPVVVLPAPRVQTVVVAPAYEREREQWRDQWRDHGRGHGRGHAGNSGWARYGEPTRWDVDGDGIPNRYDRLYNPVWDRNGNGVPDHREFRHHPYGDRDHDGVPNRYDRHDDRPWRGDRPAPR